METRNRIVKKSNKIISARIKGYTSVQKKILNLAITELKEDTQENDVISFQASDVLKVIGLGKKNHAELRKATLGMIRGVEIPEPDGTIIQVPTFKKFTYHKGGKIDIQFGEDILPYLVRAKTEYTKYFFENIQKFKGDYSSDIYELCIQYKNTKQGYRDISIDELRHNLSIPDSKYKLFGHLKSRVLDPQILEINKKSDINVSLETIKTGRKITAVRFYFSFKNKEHQIEDEQPTLPHDFKELTPAGRQLVDDYQMSPNVAVELQILATSDEHLMYAMTQYNKKLDAKYKKGEKVDNLPRYSETALRELIPTILVSGVVEKEKIKAKEKQRQSEERKNKKLAEEKASATKQELKQAFDLFCKREDLLEVLRMANLKELLKTELSSDFELLLERANKESDNFYMKDFCNLNASEVYEVLTHDVKSLKLMSKVKTSQYINITNLLKQVLQPLF
ncbi:replication initiation protein [Pseudoalteromonas sp. MTN2-4]|uniref:replication initiation protein n=1 Tax=Pseudoalteromonas sp. MTN2-4 TaxID=3056555 RepID=UPI0036F2B63F